MFAYLLCDQVLLQTGHTWPLVVASNRRQARRFAQELRALAHWIESRDLRTESRASTPQVSMAKKCPPQRDSRPSGRRRNRASV